MGIFDWLFGDDDPTPVPTPTTTVTNKLPSYVEEGWQNAIAEAERLSAQPYQQYEQPRIADFTPEQLAAFGMAQDNIGQAGDLTLGALGGITQAGEAIDPYQIDRYLNPYISGVGGQIEREMERRHATGLQDIGTSAVQAGGFGGTRHAVLEAEANRNLDRGVADMYERLYSQGYDKSMEGLQADREAQLRAGISALPGISQYAGAMGQDVETMMGIGGAQQAMTQQGLNLAYQDYLNQRDYPYQQLGFYSDIVQGVPGSGTTTTTGTQYVNDPGAIGTIADIGGGILGNWDTIKDIGSTIGGWF
jgi:hypothetical protein